MEEKDCKVTLRPIGNRVLLKRLKDEEKIKGGLLLPDASKKKNDQCEVISFENDEFQKGDKNLFKVGDIVLIEKYSPQEITLDGEEYLIVKEDQIMAIIEK